MAPDLPAATGQMRFPCEGCPWRTGLCCGKCSGYGSGHQGREDTRMKIIWLGHSGFRIEIGGEVLLVDPWLAGNPMFDAARRGDAVAGADPRPGQPWPRRPRLGRPRHRRRAGHSCGGEVRPCELLGEPARDHGHRLQHRRHGAAGRGGRDHGGGEPFVLVRRRERAGLRRQRGGLHDHGRGADDLLLRRHRRDGGHGGVPGPAPSRDRHPRLRRAFHHGHAARDLCGAEVLRLPYRDPLPLPHLPAARPVGGGAEGAACPAST